MRSAIIKRRGYPANIAGDELALTMSSYPQVARYMARAIAGKGEIVCELCCGIGVSLIELSKVFKHVVGIDNNRAVLADCQKNLDYAKAANCTLIQADINLAEIFDVLQADIVLYYIPFWSNHINMKGVKNPIPDLKSIVSTIQRKVTKNIVIYAPVEMTYTQAYRALGTCEFQQVYLNGEHSRNFIFLGDLMRREGAHKIELTT